MARIVDASVGKGHIVMFAIRSSWRWPIQGTYLLNAIMNLNDRDAAKGASAAPAAAE